MADDIIFIDHLKLPAHIGITEEERSRVQEISISIRLSASVHAAGEADDLSKTLDYSALAQEVRQVTLSVRHHLIEALAESIAAKMLTHSMVASAWIRIEKKTVTDAECVGVEICRKVRD